MTIVRGQAATGLANAEGGVGTATDQRRDAAGVVEDAALGMGEAAVAVEGVQVGAKKETAAVELTDTVGVKAVEMGAEEAAKVEAHSLTVSPVRTSWNWRIWLTKISIRCRTEP